MNTSILLNVPYLKKSYGLVLYIEELFRNRYCTLYLGSKAEIDEKIFCFNLRCKINCTYLLLTIAKYRKYLDRETAL